MALPISPQNQQHSFAQSLNVKNMVALPTTLLRVESGSSSSSSYGDGVLFPWKLHEMLDAADTKGFSSIVSWLSDGRTFKVHDKETFVSLIMGQYFEQTKYKSFQRQLNMWGFQRHIAGPTKGGYTHQHFVRGSPSLCCRMNRLKKTDRKSKQTKTTSATVVTPTSGKKTTSTALKTAAIRKYALHKQSSFRKKKMTLPSDVMLSNLPSSLFSPPMTELKRMITVVSEDDSSDNEEMNRSHRSDDVVTAFPTTMKNMKQLRPNVIQEDCDCDEWHQLFPSLDLLKDYCP